MSKTSEYQESHRTQQCSFIGMGGCFGDVTGHHLRIAGVTGTGIKAPDHMAIPCCMTHHSACHAGHISQQEQEDALALYWIERLTQEHGRAKALEMMGVAFWGVA